MWKCPICGNDNQGNTCAYCREQKAEVLLKAEKSKSKKFAVIIAVLTTVSCILIFAVMLLLGQTNEKSNETDADETTVEKEQNKQKQDNKKSDFAIIENKYVELEIWTTKKVNIFNYDGKVIWKSQDEKIATVSESGVIESVSIGSTTVTAILEDGDELTCTVTVIPGASIVETIKVTTLYLDASDITVDYTQEKSHPLKASCAPYDPNERLMWSSSDESIATVNQNGVVTLVGNGMVIITATANNGVEGSCIVRVKNVPLDE